MNAQATHTLKLNDNFTSSEIITVSADQNESVGAVNFVQDIAKRGIGFLENDKLSDKERESEFRNLLRNSFDMKTIARFALGRYWKTSTKEQQKEYLQLFDDMIVSVYSRRFKDYEGQSLDVKTARKDGDHDYIVSSLIVPKKGPNVNLDWRIRNKNNKYQVVDIIVEGVSMSMTQRSDFSSVIQRGGGDIAVLLEHLRPK